MRYIFRTFYFQTPNILDEPQEPGLEYTPPCEVLLSRRDVDEMLAELMSNGTERKRRSADLGRGNKWSITEPIKYAIDKKDYSEYIYTCVTIQ